MKERELLVLRELRKDARKQFTAIGRKTGIPVTTVFDYYKRLEKEVIKRNVALLEFEKLGYHFNTFYLVECSRADDLVEYLERDVRVNNLFELNGGLLLFEVVFQNVEEKNLFGDLLERFNPKRLDAHPLVSDVKREDFLPRAS